MSNFLNFIDEDIEAKKTLFSTMPTNTKSEIRKYNEKIANVRTKYQEYRESVKKYVEAKSKSFNIKNNKNIEELSKTIDNLKDIRVILNPTNTYIEKMGLDNLLYKISNYVDFNFNSLNAIINEFLDKFELAGIKLNEKDFCYTYYVNEYMSAFLEVRRKKDNNYDEVSRIFEKIYWVNPEIIEHIELNFKKLIKDNQKGLNNYIISHQKEIMAKNGINNYAECLAKLKTEYQKLTVEGKENISDIIDLAKTGVIDINHYFEESKARISNYNAMMIDVSFLNDNNYMEKFYKDIEKLKINIEEYSHYVRFLPLINDFKNEYQKLLTTEISNKNLKIIESEINDKESKLEKINKKIFNTGFGMLNLKTVLNPKELKMDSVKLAKELYGLYKSYDQEYFKNKILLVLNKSMTVSELLNLYYSFDYFKKNAIKRVFDINNYEQIMEYSNSFDLFAINPLNMITNGLNLFEENNISKVIVNKYRLYNINLTEDILGDDLEILLDKINFLLRTNVIEKSDTTIEKIWFMVQIERINNEANKK